MEICLEEQLTCEPEELTTTEELEDLRSEWADLWGRCPGATPFQSPHWLIPWWKHFGQGELWVLIMRREGRLAAIAPFFIHQKTDSLQRQVLLLGTGISDYLDVLVEPGFQAPATSAFASHLAAHEARWDLCDFQQLPGTSPLLEMDGQIQWRSQLTVQEVCPVLSLPDDYGDLRSQIPGHMLDKLRYYRRRAEKTAPVQMERVQPDTFPELFESFLRLHAARWGARGQKGVLADEQLRQFHREAAESMLAAGILRLYGLRLGGEIVATLYGFSHGARRFFYLGGFKPEVASLSPGTLMVGYAIEDAVHEGASEFDFLRGREAYKYMWGAKGRLNYRRQFCHSTAA